ncbi:hypothetical protein SELMODRAFT_422352 [Selaginella moellendorffii]|uniref:EF-hand domain-containing protein n=1 Tax=Selaginella moellendorffii TaxID=88036 RepID=D8SI49_SELML|nr:hypothetical protein SELMODRAFT_422352 [Selaginella moellendorffii]
MLEMLHKAFNLVAKKGGRKKPNEVDERDVPVLVRALGYNPTDQHIQRVVLRAREDEDPKHCTRGHLDINNLQKKIAEVFATDPSLSYRHTENELIACLRALSPPSQDYIEPTDLYDAMTDHGVSFTHDEAETMIRVGKDRDTQKVWHEDYAFVAASDSIPKPPNIIATEIPPELPPMEAPPPPPPPPPA